MGGTVDLEVKKAVQGGVFVCLCGCESSSVSLTLFENKCFCIIYK